MTLTIADRAAITRAPFEDVQSRFRGAIANVVIKPLEQFMNKSELVDAVSNQSGLAKADAARAVDAVFDAISAALKSGDSVALVGFGTFAVKARAARTGRNPRTGEPLNIAASKMPVFRAGKALKDAVN